MWIPWAVVAGFCLDLLLGDPAWMPHPVIWMGKAITRLEVVLRAKFPQTSAGALAGGRVLAALLPLATLAISGGVCALAAFLNPWLGFGVQALWCWQALAIKGLATESRAVYRQLQKNDLPAARTAVARIVGRDTQELTATGVAKAAIETVAENASDGVVAPLCYMLLGGAPLALAYKAINTMDSMVGYKNSRYLYFGRAAAKLDDAANYLPSRLAALFFVAAAGLTGQSLPGAFKIWRRDRRNHPSPNSAQTEAACAGALGVQLAGPAYYGGTLCQKPTLGDALRPVEAADILRANKLLYVASLLALAVGVAVRVALQMMIEWMGA
ncbi:MAG: adenosylcobinamide-phosphate synthase CbiB [Gemmiger sp.]|nr:adenosylcobinamide-phosphate synthase CbiB [Gemmiger sp.]